MVFTSVRKAGFPRAGPAAHFWRPRSQTPVFVPRAWQRHQMDKLSQQRVPPTLSPPPFTLLLLEEGEGSPFRDTLETGLVWGEDPSVWKGDPGDTSPENSPCD